VDGDRLVLSHESEKDSFPRYDPLGPSCFMQFMADTDRIPDVFCLSGWPKGFHSADPHQQGAGYFGADLGEGHQGEAVYFGKQVRTFTSTHERSHIWCSYGLSPYAQGEPVYCLVWEGNIGRFYEIDENLNVRAFETVLTDPGNKYSFLFGLADPTFPTTKGAFRFENAGKLMALAAYGANRPPTQTEKETIDWILDRDGIVLNHSKLELQHSPYFNCGVEAPAFRDLARQFSNAVFDRFFAFASANLKKGYPLVIGGGCGLNCDWNAAWRDSNLFADVFVPPAVNDSGSAIGTAIDAKRHFTGNAKVNWSVYAGPDIHGPWPAVAWVPYDPRVVAEDLAKDMVVAFMTGRCEMGPRALGGRSILASPFSAAMTRRLNKIKGREGYRPIAPIVLEEDYAKHFDLKAPSPFMLFFCKVTDQSLAAVTHVDGSARPQTLNAQQQPPVYNLLKAFKERTGVGVLCNTSLNFSGRGFINAPGDLLDFCRDYGIDAAVCGDRYVRMADIAW